MLVRQAESLPSRMLQLLQEEPEPVPGPDVLWSPWCELLDKHEPLLGCTDPVDLQRQTTRLLSEVVQNTQLSQRPAGSPGTNGDPPLVPTSQQRY